jgi:hypothetical protein
LGFSIEAASLALPALLTSSFSFPSKVPFATRIPGDASNLNLVQGAELIEVISESFRIRFAGLRRSVNGGLHSTVKEVTHSTEAWRK